jgi:hypothetical protein
VNGAREFFKQNDFNETKIKLLYTPHNIHPDKILNIYASTITGPSRILSIKSRAKFA